MVADAAPPASNCGRQRFGARSADVARLLDLLGSAARSVDRAAAPAVPARVVAPHRRRNDCRSRTPQRRSRADTVDAGGAVRSGGAERESGGEGKRGEFGGGPIIK